MNLTDKTLLTLVRYAVGDVCDDDIHFNKVEWNEVISLSQLHTIAPLAVDGLQKYLSAYPSSPPFAHETTANKLRRMQWFGQVVTYEKWNAKHERTMADLARLYKSKDIRMMVLKGYGLSLDWPVPCHRPVGDLDIYNFGKWQEADALVADKCGIKIDDGHEHHTVFMLNGIPIENHYDFINTKAHKDAPTIEKKLKQLAADNYRKIEVHGAEIYLPSANFNALFLMRHMGQHFAGEHLNLRQVLDWGFFVRAHTQEVDWNATIRFLKEIGLYTFFCQINAICVDYLGFPEQCFPTTERHPELEERILADILHPEFAEEKPDSGLVPILLFKVRRWWYNRWKHPLVYKEWLLPMFLTLLWSHLRRYKTIKD